VASAKRTPPQKDARPRAEVDDGHAVLDGPGGKTISDAAIVAMSEHGYHGTSVRDIADRAGMSSAALYHHFASKQDLLFRITDRGIDALVRQTEDALLDSPSDPAARLRAIVRVHVLTHAQNQQGSFIGNSEIRSLEPANRAIVVSKRDQQKRIFHRVVLDGVERGVFTTPYPKEATMAIVTMCTAVAQWYRPDGPLQPDQIADRYAELGLAMLGYRPRPARRRFPAPVTDQ
jgi:AcrR family transcriptional regulator